MKTPGSPGAGSRRFASEFLLCEATACPIAELDGTVCSGPRCANWRADVTLDDDGRPVAAAVSCAIDGRPQCMGTICKRPSDGEAQ